MPRPADADMSEPFPAFDHTQDLPGPANFHFHQYYNFTKNISLLFHVALLSLACVLYLGEKMLDKTSSC